MKLYEITADCLVDWCVCRFYVRAKNERIAWGIAYNIAMRDSVMDSGTLEIKRVKTPDPAIKIKGVII